LQDYDKNLTPRAQEMRKNATIQENRLWYDFLRRHSVHFYRQKIIGEYIVDFYCPVAKLVIEVDGKYHDEPAQMEYDTERTEYLNAREFYVLRFRNEEVDSHFKNVCQAIEETVKERIQKIGPYGASLREN